MTFRQKLLSVIYPFFMWVQKIFGKRKYLSNVAKLKAVEDLYSMQIELTNGKRISLSLFKGKKILFVNTASDCGYTAQYAELQRLYQHMKEDVEIIAVPSNDFKHQEQSSNATIEMFCKKNYGITFPIMKKTVVIKTNQQHALYQWLSNKEKNGWLDKEPSWNFSKYLVSEEGHLMYYFEPSVSPLSKELIDAINE